MPLIVESWDGLVGEIDTLLTPSNFKGYLLPDICTIPYPNQGVKFRGPQDSLLEVARSWASLLLVNDSLTDLRLFMVLS